MLDDDHERDIFVQVSRKHTEKPYLAFGLMTRTDCSIYATAGSDVSRRTPHVLSVLQLV